MIDSLGTILAALSAIVAVGAVIVGGVLWASRRRMDEATEKAAQRANAGGPGGPSGPV